MKYISTRDNSKTYSFKEIFLQGLAPDGGLFVAQNMPRFSQEQINSFKNLSYQDLCFQIIYPFVSENIGKTPLEKIINQAYQGFSHKKIAPVKKLGQDSYLLELFHGPSAAFKDFALQLVGGFVGYFLKEENKKAVILGATSGDTGSAAIMGCKDHSNVDIFILHPLNGTSEIQRKQMTTIENKNVFNSAIKGNFDDCQNIVKNIFANQSFLTENDKNLIAINSINWLRIIAQIVYYFYAYYQIAKRNEKINFSVPTGNFGDILAGYLAKEMGLPIDKLIIATNKNDILTRFINNNSYKKEKLEKTYSPAMDIQISSNFERLLFLALDKDSDKLTKLMNNFQEKGELSVAEELLNKIKKVFLSHSTNNQEIINTIKEVFATNNKIIDPHTATAINSSKVLGKDFLGKIINIATAHPAKFPEILKKANISLTEVPKNLTKVLTKKEKYNILDNSISQIIDFIKDKSL